MSLSVWDRGRASLLDERAALARALAGARIGLGALAANRQAAAMAKAAIAAQVHQPLDVDRHLAPEVALDRDVADLFTDALEVGVGQILDLAVPWHAGGGADLLRRRAADAVDRSQADLGVLVGRDVDAGNACHVLPSESALTLLVTRVGANHAHDALAPHDLAMAAHLLDRCCDFHFQLLLVFFTWRGTRCVPASGRTVSARR